MTRIPLVLALVLAAAAFAGGYLLRSAPIAGLPPVGAPVLAQTPPSPSPVPSPRGSRPPWGQSGARERGILVGTVENLNGRTLVVKVSSARGTSVAPGAMLSVQVDADASVLREIPLSDLRKGQVVTLRGSVVDGKLMVRQIVVELR